MMPFGPPVTPAPQTRSRHPDDWIDQWTEPAKTEADQEWDEMINEELDDASFSDAFGSFDSFMKHYDRVMDEGVVKRPDGGVRPAGPEDRLQAAIGIEDQGYLLSNVGNKGLLNITGISDVVEPVQALRATKKISSGEAEEKDYRALGRFLAKADRKAQNKWWESARDIVLDMPSFVAQIAMSSGLAAPVRKSAQELAEYGIRRAIRGGAETAAKRRAVRAAGATAGLAAGAASRVAHPATYPLTAGETMRRQVSSRAPGIRLNEDARLMLTQQDPEPMVRSLSKAAGSTFVEMFSEETGGALIKGGRLAKNWLAKATPRTAAKIQRMKERAAAEWLADHPDKTLRNFLDQVSTESRWHGVWAEFGEERVADMMHGTLGTGDFGMLGSLAEGDIGEAAEQAAAELSAFGVMPAGRAALERGGEIGAGPRRRRSLLEAIREVRTSDQGVTGRHARDIAEMPAEERRQLLDPQVRGPAIRSMAEDWISDPANSGKAQELISRSEIPGRNRFAREVGISHTGKADRQLFIEELRRLASERNLEGRGDAGRLREDEGRVPPQRVGAEAGEEEGRPDLEQQAPGQPGGRRQETKETARPEEGLTPDVFEWYDRAHKGDMEGPEIEQAYLVASNADRLAGPERRFHDYVSSRRADGREWDDIADEFMRRREAIEEPAAPAAPAPGAAAPAAPAPGAAAAPAEQEQGDPWSNAPEKAARGFEVEGVPGEAALERWKERARTAKPASSMHPDMRAAMEGLVRSGQVPQEELDEDLRPDVLEREGGGSLRTGEPVRVEVFRGEGRESQESVYAEGADGPSLGPGRYSAIDERTAEKFGPRVERGEVALENPYVLTSDKQLAELMGVGVVPRENEARVPLLKRARQAIEAKGHDGVIVNVPKGADMDPEGNSAKRLREVFGDTQVVQFSSKDTPAPKRPAPKRPEGKGGIEVIESPGAAADRFPSGTRIEFDWKGERRRGVSEGRRKDFLRVKPDGLDYVVEIAARERNVDLLEDEPQAPSGREPVPPAPPAAPPTSTPVPDDFGTIDAPYRDALGQHFREQFRAGKSYSRITDARKEAGDLLGGKVEAGKEVVKEIDEAIDFSVAMAARDIVESASPEDAYDQLVDLYQRQPTLGVRTSTSVSQQAYSTPAPMAYAAQQLADVRPSDTVLDTSAGHGMLLTGVDQGQAVVNELNEERAELLETAGFSDVTQQDATAYQLPAGIDSVDRVILNPPFGKVHVGKRQRRWNVPFGTTTEIDHAITARSLEKMDDAGRAVLLLGTKGAREQGLGKRKSYMRKNKPFYRWLYDNYNVTDHFVMSGEMYSRQGAKFPVDMIVIDGAGKATRPYPWQTAPREIQSYEELGDVVRETRVAASGTEARLESRAGGVRGGAEAGGEGADLGSVPRQAGGGTEGQARPAEESEPGVPPRLGGSARTSAAPDVPVSGQSPSGRGLPGPSGRERDRGEPVSGEGAEPAGGRAGDRGVVGPGNVDGGRRVTTPQGRRLRSMSPEMEDREIEQAIGDRMVHDALTDAGMAWDPAAGQWVRTSGEQSGDAVERSEVSSASGLSEELLQEVEAPPAAEATAAGGEAASLSRRGSGSFARRFSAAFDKLDREGTNLVSLVDLRRELSDVSREDFDRGLQSLRQSGRYGLAAAESIHGISQEEREAGIREGDTLLLHVIRKRTEKPKKRLGGQKRAEKPKKTLEEKKAESRQEIDSILDEIADHLEGKMFTGAMLDPKLLTLGTKLAGASLKHGVYSFASYVELWANRFGREKTLQLSDTIERSWRAAQSMDSSGKMEPAGRVRDLIPEEERPEAIEAATDEHNPEHLETELQVPYQPRNDSPEPPGSSTTLIPANLADGVHAALDDLAQEVGPLVPYVAEELGFSEDHVRRVFSGPQVDAVALGISNAKKGRALVNGDETGLGKGRPAAAMMWWAKRQGLVPIFVTARPTLYADMIRDLTAIGVNTEASPFEALPIGNLVGDDAIDLPDGRTMKIGAASGRRYLTELTENLSSGKGMVTTVRGSEKRYDAIFTSYSQWQPQKDGAPTWRHGIFSRLAPRSFLVLDEVHLAGGGANRASDTDEDGDPRLSRATFTRDLLRQAAGGYYSSATFAKTPDVMDLYLLTDMALAVSNIEDLPEAIHRGGISLQQAVSAMLARAGQYVRREKSFDDATVETTQVDVNLNDADRLSMAFRAINDMTDEVAKGRPTIDDLATSEGMELVRDPSIGTPSVEQTTFASTLWNLVDQMLLSMKSAPVVDEAIRSLKDGNKVIVAVDKTMEAPLKRFARMAGLQEGDSVDMTFRDLLYFYLERSREVRLRDGIPDSEPIVHYLTDEEMGPKALEAYNHAKEIIDSIEIEAPASPLDWMLGQLQSAGYRTGEVTGRKLSLKYEEGSMATLSHRSDQERGKRHQVHVVKQFNDGEVDVLLINRSGSTGISMHSSRDFRDTRPRHMVIAQAALNIDEFMQMLGRIKRVGQIHPPRYSLLLTNIPAENRPAAVLLSKLRSLNANLTGDSEGILKFEAPDIMNVIGDRIVYDFLAEEPDMTDMMNLVIVGQGESNGIAKRSSGRVALLPIEMQTRYWTNVITRFNEEMSMLDEAGINPLRAKVKPYDAITEQSLVVFQGNADDPSPFSSPVLVETMSVKTRRKPYSSAQLIDLLKDRLETSPRSIDSAADSHHRKMLEEADRSAEQQIDRMVAKLKSEEQKRLQRQTAENRWNRIREFVEPLKIGQPFILVKGDENPNNRIPVIVTDVSHKTSLGRITAPSSWIVAFASADENRTYRFRVNQFLVENSSNVIMPFEGNRDAALEIFDSVKLEGRRKATMLTGNLLAAVDLNAFNSKMTVFRQNDGEVRMGVEIPDMAALRMRLDQMPVPFKTADQVDRFLDREGVPRSADGNLFITRTRGKTTVSARKSRASGGKYFLNGDLLDALESQFVSSGNWMRAEIPEGRFARVVESVMELTTLQADVNREAAREITGDTSFESPSPSSATENALRRASQDDVRQTYGAGPAGGMIAAEKTRPDKMVVPEEAKPDNADHWEEIQKGYGVSRPTLADRISEASEWFAGQFRPRQHLPVAWFDSAEDRGKYAVADDIFRRLSGVRGRAFQQSIRLVDAMVTDLGPKEFGLFNLVVLYENIVASGNRGEQIAIFDSMEEAKRELAKIKRIVAANPNVQHAVDQRKAIVQERVRELVDRKLLPKSALDRAETYYHQMVLAYVQSDRFRKEAAGLQKRKRSFMRRRKLFGEERRSDENRYNYNFIEAEIAWLTDAYMAMQIEDMLRTIREQYDDGPRLKRLAARENYLALVGGEAKARRIEDLKTLIREHRGDGEVTGPAINELMSLDPTYPHRIEIAQAFQGLQKVRPDLFQGEDEMTIGMAHGYSDPDVHEALDWAAVKKIAEDPRDPSTMYARWLLKAVNAQREMIRTTLGKRFKTYQDMIGEDQELWTPDQNNVFYPVWTVPERILHEAERQGYEILGIPKSDLRMALAMGGKRDLMVLPTPLVKELDKTNRKGTPSWMNGVTQYFVPAWKEYVLHAPWRIIGYSARNVTGDLDALIAATGKGAFPYVARSFRELYDFYKRDKPFVSDDFRLAYNLSVIPSGISAQEIYDVPEMQQFERLFEELEPGLKRSPANPARMLSWYRNWAQSTGMVREGVFRYAAFLYFREELKKGTLDFYAASDEYVIEALKATQGVDVAAARMASEALGDYASLSQWGRRARSTLMPFWSFKEINLRRYPKMYANALANGRGGQAAMTAGMKVAGLTTRVMALYGLWWLWNNLVWPDEEDALSDTEKSMPHLLVGRGPDGSMINFRNVGAIGDLLEWGGLNVLTTELPALFRDQTDVESIAQEMGRASVNNVYGLLGPYIKALFEVPTGLSLFPDVFNPRASYRWDMVDNYAGLSAEGDWVRNLLPGSSESVRPYWYYRWLGPALVRSQDSHLTYIHSQRRRFEERKGMGDVRVLSVSEYKPLRDAAKNGDYEAFANARQDLIESEGSPVEAWEGFVQHTRWLDPVARFLNDDMEREFIDDFLTKRERSRLGAARSYAADLEAMMLLWWETASRETDEPAERMRYKRQLAKERIRLRHRSRGYDRKARRARKKLSVLPR